MKTVATEEQQRAPRTGPMRVVVTRVRPWDGVDRDERVCPEQVLSVAHVLGETEAADQFGRFAEKFPPGAGFRVKVLDGEG